MEISKDGNLLYDDGYMKEPGWNRKANRVFNPDVLSSFVRLLRLKRWDFYDVIHEDFFLGIAFADVGYASVI